MAFGCHSRGGPNGNIYIFRNVADLRKGVFAGRGTPDDPQGRVTTYQIFLMHGRGKPLGMESMYFYQNTFVSRTDPYGYAQRTLSKANSVSKRRVFNNICVYLNRYGRLRPFGEPTPDIHCDGNLHWCANPDVTVPEDYLARIQNHPVSIANKESYPPGWASKAIVANPRFVRFSRIPDDICDWRLQDESKAVGAGIVLPDELEDPLRPRDNSAPDIGAIPLGEKMFRAGRFQRQPKQE